MSRGSLPRRLEVRAAEARMWRVALRWVGRSGWWVLLWQRSWVLLGVFMGSSFRVVTIVSDLSWFLCDSLWGLSIR